MNMTGISYGKTIRWTDFDGTRHSVGADECETSEEANAEAIKLAREFGWTPSRWWQWWRWGEQVEDYHERSIYRAGVVYGISLGLAIGAALNIIINHLLQP